MELVRLMPSNFETPALKPSGFSLIELMISVGISSMIALVTGGIIVNAMKTMQTANNQGEASSLVQNIRDELSDAMYANTVTLSPTTGTATVAGSCAKSFSFEGTSMPMGNASTPGSILYELAHPSTTDPSSTCVPVKITLTRSNNATVSADTGSNSEANGSGYSYIKSLEFCDPSTVESSNTSTIYSGELYINQSLGSSNVLGTLANEVMGAGYGVKQYVSRIVVGVDNTTGQTVSCDAPSNSQMNGQNCVGPAFQYDASTQTCKAVAAPSASFASATMCKPIVDYTHQFTGVGSNGISCLNVTSVCSAAVMRNPGPSNDAMVAGGFHNGRLDCDREDWVPPSNTTCSPTSTTNSCNYTPPNLNVAGTDITETTTPSPYLGVTISPSQTMTSTGGMPNTANDNVNTIAANGTGGIPSYCQSQFVNYLGCLTAKNDLAIQDSPYKPKCTALRSTPCSTAPSTTPAPTTASATPTPTNGLRVSGTGLSASSLNCVCGTDSSPNHYPIEIGLGAYCGYCALHVDSGLGTYVDLTNVEECTQEINPDGTKFATLVPVPNSTIQSDAAGGTFCTNDYTSGRRAVMPIGGSKFEVQ